MFEPLAMAILFGLLSSTVLALGVVPTLYSILFGVRCKGFKWDGPATAQGQTAGSAVP